MTKAIKTKPQEAQHTNKQGLNGIAFPHVAGATVQLQNEAPKDVVNNDKPTLQPKTQNKTGLPDKLKLGIERLSGYSMDDVRVHRNSSKPAQLQAYAYAQGTDIHLAAGQERHLPHEAWHVVQQKQGRVKPTLQMKSGHLINDNEGLEREADMMGERALNINISDQDTSSILSSNLAKTSIQRKKANQPVIQAYGLANVVLAINPETEIPFISKINFKERVPTTTKGSSQGDHTVAEALIEASIKSLENYGVKDFLFGLLRIIESNLTGKEEAQHTEESSGKKSGINVNTVYGEIQTVLNNLNRISHLLISQILSDLTTKVWRLLSKRDLTAFDRRDGLTTGGGNGAEESKAIKEVRTLDVPERSWNQSEFVDKVAGILLRLVDVNLDKMKIEDQKVIFRRAAEHVGDAIEIRSADWKNRVAASLFNQKHVGKDGLRMAPAKAPLKANFKE